MPLSVNVLSFYFVFILWVFIFYFVNVLSFYFDVMPLSFYFVSFYLFILWMLCLFSFNFVDVMSFYLLFCRCYAFLSFAFFIFLF